MSGRKRGLKAMLDQSFYERNLVRYSGAVLAIPLAYYLRVLLVMVAGSDLPLYLTFFPAVFFVAILFGAWPGILTTILSVLFAEYYLVPAVQHAQPLSRGNIIRTLFFALMGVLMSPLAEKERRGRQQVAYNNDESKLRKEKTDRRLSEFVLQIAEHQSRAKLDAALASMTDAVFISDSAGNFLDFNDAFATFHRFKDKSECLKKLQDYPQLFEVYNSDGDLCPLDQWAVPRALRGEIVSNEEYSIRRKDTGEAWVGSFSFSPIRDQDGEIVGSVVVGRDVTHEKAAEDALRRHEERLRLALESADMVDWEMDLATTRFFRSLRHDQLFGYNSFSVSWTLETLLGHVLPDYLPRVQERFQSVVHENSCSFEFPIRRLDGQVRWLWTSMRVMHDLKGSPTRLVGISMDISQRKLADEAQRENLKMFRLAHKAAGLGTFIVELPGGDRICSPEVLEILGVPDHPPRMTQREVWEGTLPEDRHLVETQHTDMMSGKAVTFVRRAVRPDGSTRWLEISGSSEFDSSGKPFRFIGICRDVTESKQIEQTLRENEERLRLTQLAAGLGSFEIDLDTGKTVFSSQMLKLFGLPSHSAWPGFERMVEITHPDDRDLLRAQHAVMRAGRSVHFERRVILPDGSIRWIEVAGSSQTNGSGAHRLFRGIGRDVTGRKLADEALRKSEERLRIAQNVAGMGSFIVELPSQEITWSGELADILGTTGAPSAELLLNCAHPDDRQLFRHNWTAIVAGGSVRFEHRITRPDGQIRWVELSGKPTLAENGAPARFYGIYWDVTERRDLEARFQQAQKMEAIGQIAGGVAHDFNNMLGIIVGNLELLSDRIPPDATAQKYFERVRTAVRSASSVTRQLLSFSRKQIIQPVILNLNNSVEQLNKMIQRLIGEHIKVSLALQVDIPAIKADPGQVEQVLLNLVVNARDAMPQGGKIFIGTSHAHLDEEFVAAHLGSSPGDFVKLSLADTGCGMTQEILKHIFEPFFTTKETGKGTGLGLATVYGIVKQAGGYIAVTSQPGLGTTFDVYFPSVSDSTTDVTLPVAATPGVGTETILLVEDEEQLRDVTRIRLTRLGYKIIEAAKPTEAIEQFARHNRDIDMVLSDVVMPEMNGRVLAEKLRESRPDLPVLYMSGYTDDEILHQGPQSAEDMIVTKPFTIDTLSSRIRKLLDSRPGKSKQGDVFRLK